MQTLGERVKKAREDAGLTQAELAERIGMSQQAIGEIERNRSKNPTRLHEIARACGVSLDYLLGRPEGAPLKTKSAEPEIAPEINGAAVPEYDVLGGAAYGGGLVDAEYNEGGFSSQEAIAHWGLPTSFVERELGLHYGFADIIRVKGDSMDDGSASGLKSGDRVIVDRRDTDTRQGGIFAVFDGEGVIIKQVELIRGHRPARIVCKSRNAAYDPIPLTLELPVRVIGRVAGKISRM